MAQRLRIGSEVTVINRTASGGSETIPGEVLDLTSPYIEIVSTPAYGGVSMVYPWSNIISVEVTTS